MGPMQKRTENNMEYNGMTQRFRDLGLGRYTVVSVIKGSHIDPNIV